MTSNYWLRLQDLIREYAYKHALYHHLYKFGVDLGTTGQALKQAQVKQYLAKCKVEQMDYILSGLVRGHAEGLKKWRKSILEEQRKARTIANPKKELNR